MNIIETEAQQKRKLIRMWLPRMKDAGLKSYEVARYAKISKPTLSKYLNGKIVNPKTKHVEAVERVLRGFGV